MDGNLLESRTDVIAHQVNCQGIFNSGVAKAIKDFDAGVYNDYRWFCSMNTPEQLLGSVRYYDSSYNGRIYANLFAQKSYGYDGKQYTDVKALKKCFEDLRMFCSFQNLSIAMPYKIGCVRGGADWNEVYSIIEEVFEKCNVELWRLDKG